MIDSLSFPPLCMEHPTAPGQYQGSAQWNLSVPSSAQRHPSPHDQSPNSSHVPLSEQPSSSTSNPMLTPYYYEPDQAQSVAQDTGDYQQWVENYNTEMHYPYPPEHQQAQNMLQMSYAEPHPPPQPSMPASMANTSAMQPPMQNQYRFAAPYMTPAHPPQQDTYAQNYSQARFEPQRSPQDPRQAGRTHPQQHYLPPAVQQSIPDQAALHAAYQQQISPQYISMHDPGMAGMQLPYSQHPTSLPNSANSHASLGQNFTFEYGMPSAGSVPGAGGDSFTPSSQHSGLPSTPSSRDTSDDRPPPQATTSNASAPQPPRQPLIAPRPEPQVPQAPAPVRKPTKKRARRNVEEESGSEDEDYGAAVPPLKGPDWNASRLCVFYIISSGLPLIETSVLITPTRASTLDLTCTTPWHP